uniref:MADF domain-containing protein n=1 Tax=Timema poppense TaxID=170557 RepID=A0A7R9H4Y4_TIMPO|nr:unnamed protein product [Timema poppensis]
MAHRLRTTVLGSRTPVPCNNTHSWWLTHATDILLFPTRRVLIGVCVCPCLQVIMGDRPAAERACKDPNPIIDGRKANVNLAILGAKPRGNIQPEDDENLIEEVAKHPSIFDISTPVYRDQHMKDNTWKRISGIVGRSTENRNILDSMYGTLNTDATRCSVQRSLPPKAVSLRNIKEMLALRFDPRAACVDSTRSSTPSGASKEAACQRFEERPVNGSALTRMRETGSWLQTWFETPVQGKASRLRQKKPVNIIKSSIV